MDGDAHYALDGKINFLRSSKPAEGVKKASYSYTCQECGWVGKSPQSCRQHAERKHGGDSYVYWEARSEEEELERLRANRRRYKKRKREIEFKQIPFVGAKMVAELWVPKDGGLNGDTEANEEKGEENGLVNTGHAELMDLLSRAIPGRGQRVVMGIVSKEFDDSIQVAMTWGLANAKVLRSGMEGMRYDGKPAPRLDYDPKVHKLDVEVGSWQHRVTGLSGMAAAAMAIVEPMIGCILQHADNRVVSAGIDLEGYLLPVGGLASKAAACMREGMDMLIVAQEARDKIDWATVTQDPELKEWMQAHIRGARHLLDVLQLMVPAFQRCPTMELKMVQAVGIGYSFDYMTLSHQPLHVQCRSAPGTGGLIITGNMDEVTENSIRLAYDYVLVDEVLIKQRLRALGWKGNGSKVALASLSCDIHVHMFWNGWHRIETFAYGAAAAVALIGLRVGLKARKDVGVIGRVSVTGELQTAGMKGSHSCSAPVTSSDTIRICMTMGANITNVESAVRQKLKVLGVDPYTEFADEAVAAAADREGVSLRKSPKLIDALGDLFELDV